MKILVNDEAQEAVPAFFFAKGVRGAEDHRAVAMFQSTAGAVQAEAGEDVIVGKWITAEHITHGFADLLHGIDHTGHVHIGFTGNQPVMRNAANIEIMAAELTEQDG